MKKLKGADLIAQERRRQVEKKGWTAQHDEQHAYSELAWAACYYAIPCQVSTVCRACGRINAIDPTRFFDITGWHGIHAKRQGVSGDRIRDLAKAGALIAAEIDRLQVEQETNVAES